MLLHWRNMVYDAALNERAVRHCHVIPVVHDTTHTGKCSIPKKLTIVKNEKGKHQVNKNDPKTNKKLSLNNIQNEKNT